MSNRMRITGIDFGTSTSVVKTKMYDSDKKPIGQVLFTQPLTFNNGAVMVPTVVRRKDDKCVFGYDAEVPARGPEPLRSFKLDLESEDPEKAEQAKELTRLFFKYLRNVFEHQLNTGCLGDVNSENSTIVSYPVKWSDSTRDFMISCAKEAGFENVTGMDEAEAAIRSVTVQCRDLLKKSGYISDGVPSNAMLIDMGAGTTDIVICKYTSGENFSNEILTTWPKTGDILFGGTEIDEQLKEFAISLFPTEFQGDAAKKITVDKTKAWKENNVSPAMRNGDSVSEFSVVDEIAYYSDVEVDEFKLDRDEFEKLFCEKIKKFTKLVGGAIEDSGLAPEDIDFVILTGGHSQWYFVDDILMGKTDKFGDLKLSKIKADNTRVLKIALPQETVSLGLAFSGMPLNIVQRKNNPSGGADIRTEDDVKEPEEKDYSDALLILTCTTDLRKELDHALAKYVKIDDKEYSKKTRNATKKYFKDRYRILCEDMPDRFQYENNSFIGNTIGNMDFPGKITYKKSTKEKGKGILKGAGTGGAAGAVVGSWIPGVGTVAGAVVGGVIGAFAGADTGPAYDDNSISNTMSFVEKTVLPELQNAFLAIWAESSNNSDQQSND